MGGFVRQNGEQGRSAVAQRRLPFRKVVGIFFDLRRERDGDLRACERRHMRGRAAMTTHGQRTGSDTGHDEDKKEKEMKHSHHDM